MAIRISNQDSELSPRQNKGQLFQYLLSTDPRPSMSPMDPSLEARKRVRPSLLSLYAKYFHGDLILNSCDGYAVVYLKTLTNGHDRKETTFSGGENVSDELEGKISEYFNVNRWYDVIHVNAMYILSKKTQKPENSDSEVSAKVREITF